MDESLPADRQEALTLRTEAPMPEALGLHHIRLSIHHCTRTIKALEQALADAAAADRENIASRLRMEKERLAKLRSERSRIAGRS